MLHFAAGFAADPASAQPEVQAVAEENGQPNEDDHQHQALPDGGAGEHLQHLGPGGGQVAFVENPPREPRHQAVQDGRADQRQQGPDAGAA